MSDVALVTGANRGIGLEVCRQLGRRGYTMILTAPVADGAASVVWAATLPDGGPTGRFFRDGKPIPW